MNSLRATLATVFGLLLSRARNMTEFYWAPISTILNMLSTTDPPTLAWQRFAGTALGAALGG